MKEKRAISVIISAIIVLGTIAIVAISFFSYSNIIKDDVLNISKLASTNIYSVIDNELTKPVFVSLTMANDSFVKNWLINEKQENPEKITAYLEGIRSKYNYNSVFLISKNSSKYFYYGGLNKTVSETDPHDTWYYTFLKDNALYDLDVDTDQVNKGQLTVFVNSKIYNTEGNTIGVTGVGIKMDYITKLLKQFKEDYNLEAFLVDKDGKVQAHPDVSQIEKRNILDDDFYKKLGPGLFKQSKGLNIFKVDSNEQKEYVISHYVDELDWYLIIRKDTSVIRDSFYKQMVYEGIIVVLVIVLVLTITNRVIYKYQARLSKIALTDPLVKLLNRRGFNHKLEAKLKSSKKEQWVVFIMDLDNFKKANDKFGHLEGDDILKHIARLSQGIFKDHVFARWGGDEFAGIINKENQEAFRMLNSLRKTIEEDEKTKQFNITVTIGMTECLDQDTKESVIKRADSALYKAKAEGKNKVVSIGG